MIDCRELWRTLAALKMLNQVSQESGSYLSHLSEIVEMILSHLPARSLRKTAAVNRLWRSISSRLLSARTKWTLHYFEENELDKERIQNTLENISAEPRVVILLSYKETWRSGIRALGRRAGQPDERQLVQSVGTLHSILPANCLLVGCTTERIIVPHPLDCTPSEGLSHCETGHAFVCLPRMPGVTFHQAFLRTSQPKALISWPEMFGVPRQTPVKFVILFTLSASREYLPSLAAGIRQTYGDEVVIIGGVGHDRLFIKGLVKRARVVALFISGENFRACTRQLNTTENMDFYTSARELSEEASAGTDSPIFGFLFTSRFVHRGQASYVSAQGALRRLLVPTPLLGFYSYGEYCLGERNFGQKTVAECRRFMKYNSAILCICSYRRPGSDS